MQTFVPMHLAINLGLDIIIPTLNTDQPDWNGQLTYTAMWINQYTLFYAFSCLNTQEWCWKNKISHLSEGKQTPQLLAEQKSDISPSHDYFFFLTDVRRTDINEHSQTNNTQGWWKSSGDCQTNVCCICLKSQQM